jgi:hypothetical protein
MNECKLLEFREESIINNYFFYAKGIKRDFEIKYRITNRMCEVFASGLEYEIFKDVDSAKEFCNKVNEADFQGVKQIVEIWRLK